MLKKNLFAVLLLFPLSNLLAQSLSPIQFGLLKAHDGVERYEVLLRTHQTAIESNRSVSYAGIDIVELEIPDNAKPIPLGNSVDFAGTSIVVKNTSHNCFLFTISDSLNPVKVKKRGLKSYHFRNKELKNGLALLVVEDANPWVQLRDGYRYGAARKDILLLRDGKAINCPIQSYTTQESRPVCTYRVLEDREIIFENLTFVRDVVSRYRTNLILVENQDRVIFKNIETTTPESDLFDDGIFTVHNCTRIVFDDITINGTYSSSVKSGYGIVLNNIWNACFKGLRATGEWGVFGNSNVSDIIIENCEINRFDVHCYGKNVVFKNTFFQKLYNQVSSFYGDLVFDKCTFDNFVPVLFESSYGAFTPFNIVLTDCIINVDIRRPYLVSAGVYANNKESKRKELKKVCWPNIKIDGLQINMPEGKDWFLFYVKKGDLPTLSDFSSVDIKRLNIKTKYKPQFYLSNKKVQTKDDLKIRIEESSLNTVLQLDN